MTSLGVALGGIRLGRKLSTGSPAVVQVEDRVWGLSWRWVGGKGSAWAEAKEPGALNHREKLPS